MKRWQLVLLLAAFAVFLAFAWLFFFPNPERVIRKNLQELATLASFSSNDGPLAQLANPEKLGGHFAPDAEILINIPGVHQQTIAGREQLVYAARGARQSLPSLRVEFLDMNVMLGAGRQTATVDLTVKGQVGGDKDLLVQEVKVFMRKINGHWLIKRVETVRPLSVLPEEPVAPTRFPPFQNTGFVIV